MTFGEKLRILRSEKELTQEQLAEKIFVTRTAISKWETGRGFPGIDSLKEISRLFGVTIDELISDEDVAVKRKREGELAKFFYILSVVCVGVAAVFALLAYLLRQPYFNIGGILGVAGYVACALIYAHYKRRDALKKAVAPYIISRLAVLAVVIAVMVGAILQLV